jgi:hypothetical protein
MVMDGSETKAMSLSVAFCAGVLLVKNIQENNVLSDVSR